MENQALQKDDFHLCCTVLLKEVLGIPGYESWRYEVNNTPRMCEKIAKDPLPFLLKLENEAIWANRLEAPQSQLN